MLLLTHILIALASLILATACLVSPSVRKLKVNYGLISATLISGTALVLDTGSHLLSSCLTGLVYLSVVGIITIFAQQRLARESI